MCATLPPPGREAVLPRQLDTDDKVTGEVTTVEDRQLFPSGRDVKKKSVLHRIHLGECTGVFAVCTCL